MVIHKADPVARQAKLREVYASLARTPKGRLTTKALATWRSYCDGFGISTERARQIMRGPNLSMWRPSVVFHLGRKQFSEGIVSVETRGGLDAGLYIEFASYGPMYEFLCEYLETSKSARDSESERSVPFKIQLGSGDCIEYSAVSISPYTTLRPVTRVEIKA